MTANADEPARLRAQPSVAAGTSVRPIEADSALLAELGLPQWECPLSGEVHVGTVTPHARCVIDIHVSARPPMSWRFNIIRPAERGVEHVLVEVSGASMADVWPSVLLAAQGRLTMRTVC